MKRFSAVLALTALAAAATVAMAQQPPPPSEPPASTTPQDQNQSPSPQDQSPNESTDPGASPNSESRQQTLMKECMTQIAAANPGLAQRDIQNFCDKEVNQAPPQG